MNKTQEEWDYVITPKRSLFDLQFRQIVKYKDLILLLIRRDIISTYKQTILGPLWLFIQPVLTTFIFIIVFAKIAKISTENVPYVLFYLSGVIIWNYFSDCILKTSTTFTSNQGLFGKVYFPRIIVPISIIFTNLFKLGIQLILFLMFWFYYYFFSQANIQPNYTIVLVPVLILIVAVFSMGGGMIVSALTTKYKDLGFLIAFGVQLFMYATPVVYPVAIVPEKYKMLLYLNPLTSVIETFKYSLLGVGQFNVFGIIYSLLVSISILIVGVLVFNRVEKSFIDTV